MTSSEPIFSPVSIATNSKIRMLEVSDGVYLQGDELEEYCLNNGLCNKCGKVKVRRKVVKVFGSKKWEPITTVKVDTKKSNASSKKKKSYKTVRANVDSGRDDDVEYLVYKGYCLGEKCYTLEQAKLLSGAMSHRGFGSGTGSVRSGSSKSLSSNQSNTNSKTGNSGKDKRGKFFSFRRKSSAKSTATSPIKSNGSPTTDFNDNTMFMTLPQAALPLSPVGEQEDSEHQSVSTSSVLSRMTMDPSADEFSNSMTEVSTSYLSENPSPHLQSSDDNYQTPTKSNPPNTSMSSEDLSVVPSPEVRKTYEHEFTKGSRGSPKKRYYSQDLWEAATRGDQDNMPRSQPIRQIVEETIQALQVLPAVPSIRTLDLSGLKLRRSEVDALAKLFKTGKNGTVHLQSLVLNNCGIDDSLMEILSQALYDALFTANNRIGKNTSGNNKLSKSMRHARMRLHTLDLGDNDIGDKGISSLCLYLESISCELEQLDLSRNSIETSGATAIFDALKRNPQTKIESIDLSSNLLREVDSGHSSTVAIPGRTSGIHGFLSKNKTLKELDLSTNRMVDEWVEALCRGLSLNPNSSLEHLSLGYNRIGNRGAVAIGMCLTVNKSLVLLELNDNHIENDGAQALLEAMEDNLTIKDIAGLWSNRIDKRHIIVSIRQLLVSDIRQKRKTENQAADPNTNTNNDDYSDDDSESIYITSDSECSVPTPEKTNTPLAKNSSQDRSPKNHLEEETDSDFLSVQDGGDMSDLSDQEDEDLSEAYARLMQDNGEMKRLETADGMMETNQEVTHNMFDRMTIMNSSPLVYFDDNGNNARRAISLLDTTQETEAIKAALEEYHPTRGSRIEVKEEMATLDKFKAFFSARDSSVLHLSCHGITDGIALENGYGSIEKLSLSDLKELVTGCSVKDTLELVFVSSPLALKIGKAFLESGVKAVLCCERKDIFRDTIAKLFMESFYQHACQRKTLSESFDAALRAVVSSPLSTNSKLVSNRFHLLSSSSLPSVPSSPIFFRRFIPPGSHRNGVDDIDESLQQRLESRWNDILPPLPDYFLGRELEMFKFLEALQFADCINVSGNPGCGKDSIIGSSLEYALKRSETFGINQVCWIPAQKQAMVDPDSLYGDLLLCCDLIRDSNIDLWDRSEEVMDCRERLAIELEGAKVVVVIDKQSFSSTGSQSALNKLINFIVTYTATAKVVCISAPTTGTTDDNEDSNFSAIKKSSIHIDPLSLRSTARLFGELSEHVSRSNGSSFPWYPNEFLELVDIPFIPNKTDSSLEKDGTSSRRAEILGRIGNGFPAKVISTAKDMSKKEFSELMNAVLKSEIFIDSSGTLQSEIKRWNTFVEVAMKDKNYKRAINLEAKVNELEGMKSQFTSLQDLKAKEKSMKSELANAVSNRRYDVANELKRDLLVLKKEIMKERRASTNRSGETPNGVLNDLKFQVNSLADTLEHDESLFSGEENKIFNVDCDGRTCAFSVYDSSVSNAVQHPILFESKEQLKAKGNGIVYWCNEACNLEGKLDGKLPLGVDFQKYAANLPIVHETRHGPVRCLMGNSVILDTGSSSITEVLDNDDEQSVAVLAVGPFATSSGQIDTLLERDDEFRRSSLMTLRSCYRSCMQQTAQYNLRSLTVYPLTTRTKNGPLYKETLKIAVREILEGAKFSKGLQEVRLVGKTPKEAALLVGIMKAMGYSI